jgi:polyisoprenoid-binding protein YceI
MKRTSIRQSIILSFISFVVAFAAHAADKFTLDNQHSYVLWEINHLGFSNQVGKWYVNGTLVLDKEHPKNSKVDASVAIDGLATGLPELDKHLKSPLFFDSKTYPVATFTSTKVDDVTDTSAKVTGTLTLHGVSKPVTLMVTLNKVGANPISNKMSVGFTAKTTIKRSDFGISTLLPALGDEVSIMIGAEAYKDEA